MVLQTSGQVVLEDGLEVAGFLPKASVVNFQRQKDYVDPVVVEAGEDDGEEIGEEELLLQRNMSWWSTMN